MFAIQIDGSTLVGAITVLVMVIGGFATWMFNINDKLSRLMAIRDLESEALQAISECCQKEHDTIWEKINEHATKLDSHGNRITRIEAGAR